MDKKLIIAMIGKKMKENPSYNNMEDKEEMRNEAKKMEEQHPLKDKFFYLADELSKAIEAGDGEALGQKLWKMLECYSTYKELNAAEEEPEEEGEF